MEGQVERRFAHFLIVPFYHDILHHRRFRVSTANILKASPEPLGGVMPGFPARAAKSAKLGFTSMIGIPSQSFSGEFYARSAFTGGPSAGIVEGS